MDKTAEKIEKIIEEAHCCMIDKNIEGAIDNMEQALKLTKRHSTIGRQYRDFVLEKLGSLYALNGKHDKAIKMYKEQMNKMLKKSRATSINDVDFTEQEAERMVSICLCMGTSHMNLDQPQEALNYYSTGYVLAYRYFGEFDERTLKQVYNMACMNLISDKPEEQQEAIRQLQFCYYDMREHLGERNEYTKTARKVLKKFHQNPDDLYKEHLKMRRMIKDNLSKMWE